MQSTVRAPVAPYGGPVVITSDSAPQLQIVRGDGRQRLTFALAADGRASIGASAPISIAAPLQVANLQMTHKVLTTSSIVNRAPVADNVAIDAADFGSTVRIASVPPVANAFTITLPTGEDILNMIAVRFSASARVDGATIALQIINDTAFNATLALTLVSIAVRAHVRQLVAVDSITPLNGNGVVVVLPHSTAVVTAVLIASTTPARATFVVEGVGDAIDSAAPLVTPEMFGARGDGVTDDGAALAAACAATSGYRKGKIVGAPGSKYWTATAFANPLGVRFDPSMSVYVGAQCVSTRTRDQLVTGQEYLYGFLQKAALGGAIKILFSGDSTTSGTQSDWPGFSERVINTFGDMCAANGIANISLLNYGKRGQTCQDWSTTYVAAEIAAAPDAWVWRWGINDTSMHHTPTEFATYLRDGLTAIRAAYPLSSGVSIIVMTSNSCLNLDVYFESYADVIYQAARDFQCCFIDTDALWRDAANGVNLWLDSIGVHPGPVFNRLIASVIFNTMFPRALRDDLRQRGSVLLGALTSRDATFAIPQGVAFFASCAQSSTAEYSANGHRVIGELSGLATDTGGYITIVPSTPSADVNAVISRAIYQTGPNLDGGLQGCIRFKYTPMYTGYPTYIDGQHALYIFVMGHFNYNQWQNASGSIISVQHYNAATPNGKFWVNVRNTDGTSAQNLTAGSAWSAVSGQEYEFEVNWNFTGANRRFSIFVDGTAYFLQNNITCNRVAVPMIGFGDHHYSLCGPNTFKVRDIQMFTTEQHATSPYVPSPLTSTVINCAGISAPAATFTGAVTVPAPSASAHAVPRSYADSIAPLTVPAVVNLTGGVTTIPIHLYILNTSGLITCHFSTQSGAALSTEVIASVSNASAIPSGLRPSAAYGTVTQAFVLGTATYTVAITTAGAFTIMRAPSWGIGDDLNFASTVHYYNA